MNIISKPRGTIGLLNEVEEKQSRIRPLPKNDTIGPFTEQQIIVMGLPKTGTTSVAYALAALGYNVSHDTGDTLSSGRCNVIINTHETLYKHLDKKYPNATWFFTYSQNASQWFDSFQYHFAYHPTPLGSSLARMQKCNRKFQWNLTQWQWNDFPSQNKLSSEGIGAQATYDFFGRHKEFFLNYYGSYYHDLFQLFEGRDVPIVDVRAGDGYNQLASVTLNGTQPTNPSVDFPNTNKKYNPGVSNLLRCR
jgi:hypothetical protein